MSAEEARLARVRYVIQTAAETLGAKDYTLVDKLAVAMVKVMEDEGIWLVWVDHYESELAELIKDVGE